MARKRKPKSDWYKDSYIGKEIERATLDKTRVAFWHSRNANEPYTNLTATELAMAKGMYEQENLRFFSSKTEMRDFMGADYWNNHSLDDYWRQYLYRDKLIANRQYGEIRSDIYRENYIKVLQINYGGDEIADRMTRNLRKLTPEEFYSVTHMEVDKAFWKKDDKGGLIPVYQSGLPDIGDYYPTTSPDNVLEEGEDTLKKTFDKLGIPYEYEYDYGDDTPVIPLNPLTPEEQAEEKLKKLRRASRRGKKRNKGKRASYSGAGYNIYRTMDKEHKEIFRNSSAKEIQEYYVRSHPEKVKRAKDGHYYMPFVNNRSVKNAMKNDKSFRDTVTARFEK